jgi:hypothetical protein
MGAGDRLLNFAAHVVKAGAILFFKKKATTLEQERDSARVKS